MTQILASPFQQRLEFTVAGDEIKSSVGILPLTGFLCVYSPGKDNDFSENLWLALNHPDTLFNLQFVGNLMEAAQSKLSRVLLKN